MALPSVAFYVLDASAPGARLKLACRITDKAYRAGQHVLIWHTDPAEHTTLDELLWTFDDRTFIPHPHSAFLFCTFYLLEHLRQKTCSVLLQADILYMNGRARRY